MTHVFWDGWLHPLLEDEGEGGPYIMELAARQPVAGAMPGAGTRFVRLPPAASAEARLEQLRAAGAVVGPVSFGTPPELACKDATVGGAREHLIFPNGLVSPLWFNTSSLSSARDEAVVRFPNLWRALGTGRAVEAADSGYALEYMGEVGACAHVYLKFE